MSDYGTRLTAMLFEACGREVEFRPPGRVSISHTNLPKIWCYLAPEPYPCWLRISDYTQPGHLETIIGMVRKRWPDYTISMCSDGNVGWAAYVKPQLSAGHYEFHPTPAEALMIAACRAAGLEIPDAE